jgi:hypothetical protein
MLRSCTSARWKRSRGSESITQIGLARTRLNKLSLRDQGTDKRFRKDALHKLAPGYNPTSLLQPTTAATQPKDNLDLLGSLNSLTSVQSTQQNQTQSQQQSQQSSKAGPVDPMDALVSQLEEMESKR